jgi:predicted nucleotidyltransferase
MIHFRKIDPDPMQRGLADLPRYFEKRGDIVVAYLFGFYAKGRPGPLSDVDIGVLLDREEDHRVELREKLEMLHELSRVLGTEEVDLVILNECPLSLAYEVIRERHILYESDPDKRIRFETRVIDRYLDFAYFRRVQQSYILKQLKEGTYFGK